MVAHVRKRLDQTSSEHFANCKALDFTWPASFETRKITQQYQDLICAEQRSYEKAGGEVHQACSKLNYKIRDQNAVNPTSERDLFAYRGICLHIARLYEYIPASLHRSSRRVCIRISRLYIIELGFKCDVTTKSLLWTRIKAIDSCSLTHTCIFVSTI